MKNLFSIGTGNIKTEIISNKFSPQDFFYKLLDLAPALKIKEWCNISSYEEYMSYKKHTNNITENGYEKFRSKVQTECHTIHQLFLLAYKLCQNYNFFSYFYMSERHIKPFLDSTENFPSYETDEISALIMRFQTQAVSKNNLSFIKKNLPLFKKELEEFLLISSAYTFSMSSNTTKTLPNVIRVLSQNSHFKEDIFNQTSRTFAAHKNAFFQDGLILAPLSDYYIGNYIYPDLFYASKEEKHVKIDSIYDFTILDGLIRKENNPFFKLCRYPSYAKKINSNPYKTEANLIWNEKINETIKETTKKRLEKLALPSFAKFFTENSLISKNSAQLSYDAQFVTDYIFERIFNLNYITLLSELWIDQKTYQGYAHSAKKNTWDAFFKGTLGFLFFYPLPRFRLAISKFLYPFLESLVQSAPNVQLSISPYLNGFFFQTFVYFPLIDIVFTYLLRIFKPSKKEIFGELRNILSINYQETFINNDKLTFIQKITSSPFTCPDKKPEYYDLKNFYIDFFYNIFGDTNSFYLQELSALKNCSFEKLLYSYTSKGLFFDIENINKHIMNFYQLRNYETILFPFSSEFIHLLYISQLNEEGAKSTLD